MSIIKVENLTFCYPSSYDNIFENVSFQIDSDWKLGFVGRNGRGKTTFLKLLQNQYEYEGKISSSVQFDYFPYIVEDKSKTTYEILLSICPTAEDWEFMRELSLLEVDIDALYRPFNTLSNGEQTKALLSALFLNENHFLLIDEPTNHLDTRAREIVANYLKKKKGFILVSHDRMFLDNCVDHILSINRANIEVQSGNFSSWMENFEKVQQFELAKNERLQSDIKRLQQSAQRTSAWADKVEASKYGKTSAGLKPDRGYVGHKAAKMMKRAKVTEARQQHAIEDKAKLLKNFEHTENLKISPLDYKSDTLITLSDLTIKYGDNIVCKNISFSINKGEKVFLDGKNGSGKSSIIKLLCDKSIDYDGKVHIGSQLVISYVPQDTSHLCGILSDFAWQHNLDESLFKAILNKLNFDKIQFTKDISNFSLGQKKKVLIAKSLCEKAHLYIWDEPLNYIDIYSRTQIEELIKEYNPTMLLVEHDKAFKESIATKIIKL